jgi:hypothetical protein
LFSPILPEYDFGKTAAISLRLGSRILAVKFTKAALSQNTLLAFLIMHSLSFQQFDKYRRYYPEK